jgi:hypothetical protein
VHIQVTGKDLTPVDRPPQFDFIYRANADAQARAAAETAALGTKIDQLLARRRQLEAEQSALWFKISLRGLSSRDLSDKPSYRFEPQASQTDDRTKQRLAAVAAACKFMRIINTLVKQAQPALDHDQGYVYAQLHQGVASACDELRTVLLSQPTLYEELDDSQSELGRFNRAARHLEDSSQNLVDAYRLAGDGDRAGDDQRKDSFRGQLQESAIDFTETVITADRVFTTVIHNWKVLPDISRPVPPEPKIFIGPTTLPSPDAATDAQFTQPTDRVPGPIIATSILFTVDDFVVDVYHNGVKVPDSRIHLDGEIYGATVFRVDVKVHRDDWLVFNVVNDRFRWGGAYGFAAAGLKDSKAPVFETTVGKGPWSACDAPEQALRFIRDPVFLSDKSVVIPGKPWSGCKDQMKARCDWDGETVWSDSDSRNVWIKYIVP